MMASRAAVWATVGKREGNALRRATPARRDGNALAGFFCARGNATRARRPRERPFSLPKNISRRNPAIYLQTYTFRLFMRFPRDLGARKPVPAPLPTRGRENAANRPQSLYLSGIRAAAPAAARSFAILPRRNLTAREAACQLAPPPKV